MKKQNLLIVFIFLTQLSFTTSKEKIMAAQWFKKKECTQLEIVKHKSISEHEIVKSIKIDDLKTIKKIMDRIEKIPVTGEEMISFAPTAESIDLSFKCESEIQRIEIYAKRFKTPSTGFNSGKSEVESELYLDFDSLLFPEINKKILKVENLEIMFKDFSVTYKGKREINGEPSTASASEDLFVVKGKKNEEQNIKIRSGQRSPEPFVFEVNKDKLILLTYETKEKERLYPNHFVITKKKIFGVF